MENSGYRIEDRGNRYGVYVNGVKVLQQPLRDGDMIGFGIDDSYHIVFHVGIAPDVPEHPKSPTCSPASARFPNWPAPQPPTA